MFQTLAVVTLLCFAAASGSRVKGVGYNTARLPFDAQPHPYKGRIEDTRTVSPRGIRESRLVCDETAPINRIVTCEIHTFDLCGNPDGEMGNITQWKVRVDAQTSKKSSSLIAPTIWIRRGVARFYFTPISVGVHVVSVAQDVSPARPALKTPTSMVVPVTVHDSVIYCTNYNLDEAPRATQTFAWAQASRSNERATIYGLETKTSDHTNIFQDVRTAFGTGTPTLQQTGFGRAPVAPFVPDQLSEIPRVDNSHFRFCDYLQRSA